MPFCNSCGKKLAPRYRKARDPLTGEVFTVEKCPRCGLGHTLPQPLDLSRYYAPHYYGNRHGFTLRHCIRRRLRFVDSVMQKNRGSLLDIGCGDGSFLLAAKENGWQVMGTELNPKPAQELGLDVTKEITEILSERFDCITMWHTLEHMRDIPSALAETSRLLKPEGKLIIAVPDWGGLQAKIFAERWLHLDVPRHLYHFDAVALDSALAAAGYEIEATWHQEIEYDLLGWSQSALNYLLPYQNLFFDIITGKPTSAGFLMKVIALLLGSLLTALLIPALLVGTLTRRGGTLVTVARRSGISSEH